mmetsp:Transcript_6698/g.10270  ORF Transcript_6698/g.10270 Transcript_6698/m.10270 type:complete len:448 (-) Transcript_6698:3083-4426(-)
MMSLASASSSVAAPPPGRASVSRRRGARARAIAMAARPPACAAGLRGGDGDGAGAGAGLGAVEGLRAPSARLLGARCRRGGGGVCGRRVAVVRAATLEERIASGEFTKPRTSIGETVLNAMRSVLKNVELPQSRALGLQLAKLSRKWRSEAMSKMPVAMGDIREIAGQPVFVPLYKLFLAYGEMFVLAIGPKKFVVVSDNDVAREMLQTQAKSFSKGLLSEILEFVMGTGLIPADGETWKIRRRVVVPSLHRKYVGSMVDMFGDCGVYGSSQLARSEVDGVTVEMENFYSRLALDIIGKAVFNYDFDSLRQDDPIIKAVYTVLREAEYRSVTFIPYWKVAPLQWLVPRQKACQEALVVVNDTLNRLIARTKKNRRGRRRGVRGGVHEQSGSVHSELSHRQRRRRHVQAAPRRPHDPAHRGPRDYSGGAHLDHLPLGNPPGDQGACSS